MEPINPADYKRPVTHTSYRHGDKKTKKGGWSRIMHHHITDNYLDITNKDLEKKDLFLQANDYYVRRKYSSKLSALWGGGSFYFYFCLFYL